MTGMYLSVIFLKIILLANLPDSSIAFAHSNVPSSEVFDFIVVGGGTAGSIIASRLSENYPHSELDVPALLTNHLGDPSVVKMYQSVPQANAGLKNNGSFQYLVGKVLGGGSAINGMVFNRGHPQDYKTWAEETGDTSWDYPNMLKYFKKIEDYNGNYPSDQHGYGGPIPISVPNYRPGVPEFLDAGLEMGYPTEDQNGPEKISFSVVEFNKKFGRRVSSYRGYLEPVLQSRSNLKLILNSEVKRINFDGTRAVGVSYSTNLSSQLNSKLRTVRARKEVIISAGAIGSPMLLMKSGVGPKHVLKSAKVAPVKYLPVGLNLQDHLHVAIIAIINNESAIVDYERDLTPENLQIYNTIGDGPYSSLYGSTHQAFIASSNAAIINGHKWPDVHFLGVSSETVPGLSPDSPYIANIKADWERLTSTVVLGARPKSRGTITLNTTNIDSDPIIDFQYYSHPDDVEIMIDGIEIVSRMYEETNAYRQLGARLSPNPLAACEQFPYKTRRYWKCHLQQETRGGLHGVGTCKMGMGLQDPTAVLDSKLRVIGVDGLRVVDASVMPNIVNANTQAAVFAIAEKASDMILARWRLKK